MGTLRIEFTAKLPFHIHKEDKYFVACCSILDVVSQGETKSKAKHNLVEALSLFFLSCYERGTLDAVMKECGFTPATHPPTPQPTDQQWLDVSLPFEVNNQSTIGCQV